MLPLTLWTRELKECGACETGVGGFCLLTCSLGMCTVAVVCSGRRRSVFLLAVPAWVSRGWKKLVGVGGPKVSNMHIQGKYAERQKCTEDKRVGKLWSLQSGQAQSDRSVYMGWKLHVLLTCLPGVGGRQKKLCRGRTENSDLTSLGEQRSAESAAGLSNLSRWDAHREKVCLGAGGSGDLEPTQVRYFVGQHDLFVPRTSNLAEKLET